MRRVVLVKPDADMAKAQLEIQEVDIPVPQSGEVLIKVTAAPVNPSDYGAWGRPGPDDFRPVAQGKEGSGVVVSSGGGLTANRMVGKHVGFSIGGRADLQGSYAEYVTCVAMTSVFPMPSEVKVEDAASFFVNPYTAYGIIDTAKTRAAEAGGNPVFIHTAAASQLGQMMNKLAPTVGVTIINLVRRESQAEMLRALGATQVLVTNEGWQEKLKVLIKELKVVVAFDCISGSMPGDLMNLLPHGGSVYTYGRLSGQPFSVEPVQLVYFKKKLEGWFLPTWLMSGGMFATTRRVSAASACVNAGLSTEDGWSRSQFVDCTMDTMWEEFLQMFLAIDKGGFTGKKLRIRFDSPATPGQTEEAAL